ncbi:MAG: ABC transporter permease [Eubacteriaceae bacterium]|nr:ABC transporter permease [Eubacteriaceae bacterium]
MAKYIAKRSALAVATLIAIILLLFLLLELMPGSPFNIDKVPFDTRAMIMEHYGLDRPVMERFAKYLANMLKGDFGISYSLSKKTPITALLAIRLPVSIRLGVQAVLLGTIFGLALGMAAAIWHGKAMDTIATVVSVLGVSLPSYVFALTLSYFAGFRFQLAPMLYQASSPIYSSVLPTISLSMFTIATVARFTRTELLEILGSDYMLFAESKGISGAALFFRHALRNALIPIITVLAPLIVALMTGSLVVERIFSIPGIGSLLVSAIQANDYNVIIALSFIYSAMYIFIMLVLDILYGIIDPRIRITKEGE